MIIWSKFSCILGIDNLMLICQIYCFGYIDNLQNFLWILAIGRNNINRENNNYRTFFFLFYSIFWDLRNDTLFNLKCCQMTSCMTTTTGEPGPWKWHVHFLQCLYIIQMIGCVIYLGKQSHNYFNCRLEAILAETSLKIHGLV